ncbi:MAG: hypothetical protein QM791_17850 [Ferruginibacter sp.]
MKATIKQCLFIMIITAGTLYTSCTYDKQELLEPGPPVGACDTIPAKFSADINPIIQSRCATYECHDLTNSGGYTFFEYADVKGALEAIQQQVIVQKTMPQDGPLSQTDIDKIKCWIEDGAPNN